MDASHVPQGYQAAAEKMRPLVEDLVSLARHWGSKHFSQFPNEERRQQGAGMIEEICTRLLGDGMSDVSIEEIYCDVHASSHYARRYVAPRVILHNDIGLFRRGYWVLVNYHTAFFLFQKIAFIARTIVSREGWNGVGFSGPAVAREGISRSVYRRAILNVGDQCSFSTRTRELQKDFDELDRAATTLLDETFECLSDFAFDQCWAGWIARASGEVAAAGGLDAARSEVMQYLGWRPR
jgi:hypothetical protein